MVPPPIFEIELEENSFILDDFEDLSRDSRDEDDDDDPSLSLSLLELEILLKFLLCFSLSLYALEPLDELFDVKVEELVPAPLPKAFPLLIVTLLVDTPLPFPPPTAALLPTPLLLPPLPLVEANPCDAATPPPARIADVEDKPAVEDELNCFMAVDDFRCFVDETLDEVDDAFILVIILMLVAEVEDDVAFTVESISFSGEEPESEEVSWVMGLYGGIVLTLPPFF